jgi:hypothetical protein
MSEEGHFPKWIFGQILRSLCFALEKVQTDTLSLEMSHPNKDPCWPGRLTDEIPIECEHATKLNIELNRIIISVEIKARSICWLQLFL